MANLSNKELQDILKTNEMLCNAAEICGIYKQDEDNEAKRKDARGKLAELYAAYTAAKEAYDAAVFEELHKDSKYNEFSTLAVLLAIRGIAKRFQHTNLESWFEMNHGDDLYNVYSIPNVASIAGKLYEEYRKTSEQAAKNRAAKESRAERRARLLAQLAAMDEEETNE